MTGFTDAMVLAMAVSLSDRVTEQPWESHTPGGRATWILSVREALQAAARAEEDPATEVVVAAESDGSGFSADIGISSVTSSEGDLIMSKKNESVPETKRPRRPRRDPGAAASLPARVIRQAPAWREEKLLQLGLTRTGLQTYFSSCLVGMTGEQLARKVETVNLHEPAEVFYLLGEILRVYRGKVIPREVALFAVTAAIVLEG